jgi:hypothetical protein
MMPLSRPISALKAVKGEKAIVLLASRYGDRTPPEVYFKEHIEPNLQVYLTATAKIQSPFLSKQWGDLYVYLIG